MTIALFPTALSQAIECVRPMVADTTKSSKERIHLLWAAAKAARNLDTADVVHGAFMRLAVEANLINSNGQWTGNDVRKCRRRYGRKDVAHVLSWASRGWNPFEKGPLE